MSMRVSYSYLAVLFASTLRAFAFPPRSPPIRITAAHLASASQMCASSSNSADLTRARRLIAGAISEGAPAYNADDVPKCAAVYTAAAGEIETLAPPVFRTRLRDAAGQTADDARSADAKAWALRRLFDAITEYCPPIVPAEGPCEGAAFEPFTQLRLGGEPIVVMDSVMGGVSSGGWLAKSNTFFWETSLANNGGFASLRWRLANVQNWSHAKGIYLKGLRHSEPGEHTFRIVLKDAACQRVRLANFKAVFANPEESHRPLLVPFSVFDQMEQMGRAMAGSPVFDPAKVTEIGLMAIKPSVVGRFQLEFLEWGLYNRA